MRGWQNFLSKRSERNLQINIPPSKCIVSLHMCLSVWQKLYYLHAGAVHRYYESRRRHITDSRPERFAQVARNKERAHIKAKKRNVCYSSNLGYAMDAACLHAGSRTAEKMFKKE